MNTDSDLPTELQALHRKWEQITDIPETPRSVMDVIEYSLGSQNKAEVYVNRLLKYFLDPEEPHGMDAEFLRAFLKGLPDVCGFQEDIHDLSDVQVEEQVTVNKIADGDTKSSGRLDLCICVPNEWFLQIELKFSAQDTQTEFYYQEATHIEERSKDDYESGHYYLYLRQHNRPRANETAFANWTWRAFTNDVLDPFLVENAPRHPQRTVTQLREFKDDIRSITGMTEQQQNTRKKVALYLNHYDAIKDVSDTFDEQWEQFTDAWGTRLGEMLEQERLGTYSEVTENVVSVQLQPPAMNDSIWKFRTGSSDWGMIFKDGWWRHTDDFESLNARPDDRNDVRIGFHHRLGRNRDLAIGEQTLNLYFRNMGANDQVFRDAFANNLYDRRDELAGHLPPTIDVTGNKRNMLVATYDIDTEEYDDFFSAYIGALQEAFLGYVVEGKEGIALIDEVYQDSLQEVYDASIELS